MFRSLLLISLLFLTGAVTLAQTTEFTYQGDLKDGTSAANANYDLEFRLFAADIGGTAIGTLQRPAVPVSNGSFSVKLDFGAQFPGAGRFLEIAVKPAGGGSFTTLTPRQQISNAPYSVRSLNATNADSANTAANATNATTATNALQLGNIAANQYVLTTDPRMTDSRPPTSGSDNYIQNRTTPQGGNFNIGGDGTVGGNLNGNILNANVQYNIGGSRVLSIAGSESVSVGVGTSSSNQSFQNTFVGAGAGFRNSGGSNNAFFGRDAGTFNVAGFNNVFIGSNAGFANSNGNDNSFFGMGAGENNVSGGANVFIGKDAASRNSSASFNTFVGFQTGFLNSTGTRNTLIGAQASVASADLTNVTAIGSRALVAQSNSIILGSINGVNQATADTNVGIGTTAPATKLHVSGAGIIRARINSDSNAGVALTLNDQPGWSVATVSGGQFQIFNDAIGSNAVWIDSANNVGIGTGSPDQKLSVNGNASKPGGGSWLAFSDERLKNIKGRFTPGLSAVMRLQPVIYRYKTQNALGIRAEGEHVGFSAQEVEKVIPEAVTKNAQGYRLINNDPILWAMLNAVKEQQAEIEALGRTAVKQQDQINKQQEQIEQLSTLLCSLKADAGICKDRR